MTELSPDLLRRVLVVFQFDGCDSLFWRVDDGVLTMYVLCSDFFAWACADVESVETEADVEMLEQAARDLTEVTKEKYSIWTPELYAARRRNKSPADFMLQGRHALPLEIQVLFPKGDK